MHAAQGVSETLARGNVKNIVISMEDRMGGRKHLTHLSHVEGFGLDPDELAAVLQVMHLRCITCTYNHHS